jgi:hypothetical protein
MNLSKNYIKLSPFIIVCIIMSYTIFSFIFIENFVTIHTYLALLLIAINAVIYLKNFEWGIAFTGILLILGLFNLVVFFTDIENFSVGFFVNLPNGKTEIKTPKIRLAVLLILGLYWLLNRQVFLNKFKQFINRKSPSN